MQAKESDEWRVSSLKPNMPLENQERVGEAAELGVPSLIQLGSTWGHPGLHQRHLLCGQRRQGRVQMLWRSVLSHGRRFKAS
eukprot:49222-Hanusia_phi.AAC.1